MAFGEGEITTGAVGVFRACAPSDTAVPMPTPPATATIASKAWPRFDRLNAPRLPMGFADYASGGVAAVSSPMTPARGDGMLDR
jgi:hypothetical protein